MSIHVTKLRRLYLKQKHAGKLNHLGPLFSNLSALKVYQTAYTNI